MRLYYRAFGSRGDTVVVLHGNPGYHMNYLAPNLAALAGGRTLLFYDQRGGGRSEPISDPEQLSIARHVADLEALRRHFRLDRLVIIGHSWGGGLAAMYAFTHPAHVTRLILLAPMPVRQNPYGIQTAERFRSRLADSTWSRLSQLDQSLATSSNPLATCRDLMAGVIKAPLYFKDNTAAAQFRGDFCDAPPESLRRVPFVREAFHQARGNWDLQPRLRRITAPTLVVHGEHDAIPVEAAREWATALPNAYLLLVPGADHFVFADGAELVMPAVDQFLNGRLPSEMKRGH